MTAPKTYSEGRLASVLLAPIVSETATAVAENQKGKSKRLGGRGGRRDHAKKAYVSLKAGQELNFTGEAA